LTQHWEVSLFRLRKTRAGVIEKKYLIGLECKAIIASILNDLFRHLAVTMESIGGNDLGLEIDDANDGAARLGAIVHSILDLGTRILSPAEILRIARALW
jgi:hypothetical protein